MRIRLACVWLAIGGSLVRAALVWGEDPAPQAPSVTSSPAAAAPITRITDAPPATPGSGAPAQFAADATWQTAGYNNNEIVYTITVVNQDSRIIHCNVELHGFYFDNGRKLSISDRQSGTIFPGKQAIIGHWLGMDEKSGATYRVTCRAL